MDKENKTFLDSLSQVVNPKITTVIEFDTKSTMMLGAVLVVVLVIAIVIWALARKASNN